MLNKYLVLLLLAGLLVSFLVTSHRIIFRKKSLYLAIGIAFPIFLPNLIWQIVHDLPVVGHMQALNERQLVNVDRSTFLFDQINMTFATSIVMILGLAFLLKTKKHRFLGYAALFIIGVLILLRGKSYYTLGVLPLLIAAGAVFVGRFVQNQLLRWAIPSFMIVMTIPIIPFGLPIYRQAGMVSYFKDLEDDFGLLLGRRFEDGSIHSLP